MLYTITMETINKATRAMLIAAVVCSVLFVAGIPMIVLGAVNKLWPVMVLGIVFTGGGFYATPLLWVGYGGKVTLKRLVYAIEAEHIYTVPELAEQLSKRPKEIRGLLDTCFNKRYLAGYKRAGDTLVLNEGKALADAEHAAECPYCGAKFSYKGTDAVCPYCRSRVK